MVCSLKKMLMYVADIDVKISWSSQQKNWIGYACKHMLS